MLRLVCFKETKLSKNFATYRQSNTWDKFKCEFSVERDGEKERRGMGGVKCSTRRNTHTHTHTHTHTDWQDVVIWCAEQETLTRRGPLKCRTGNKLGHCSVALLATPCGISVCTPTAYELKQILRHPGRQNSVSFQRSLGQCYSTRRRLPSPPPQFFLFFKSLVFPNLLLRFRTFPP